MKIIIWTLLFFNFSVYAQVPSYKDYSKFKPNLDGNHFYNSEENHYRIKVPVDWLVQIDQTLGNELTITSKDINASLSINVGTSKTKYDFSAYDAPVQRLFQEFKNYYPTAEFLKSERTYLANEKCTLMKVKYTNKTTGEEVIIYVDKYYIIKDNLTITITCLVPETFKKKYDDAFIKILSTFAFIL
jgi:hypothetical protein